MIWILFTAFHYWNNLIICFINNEQVIIWAAVIRKGMSYQTAQQLLGLTLECVQFLQLMGNLMTNLNDLCYDK